MRHFFRIALLLIMVQVTGFCLSLYAAEENYFKGITYRKTPVPVFKETKAKLPTPIFDENPDYVRCYWKAWELGFKHFRAPHPKSPFVSNYIDEAFNEGLFLWDTSFMTMFCNYAHPYVPGIQSLDNFYCSQLPDGEIVREISEITGVPRARWSKPGTPDSLNHPILAWAELEAYKISGDTERLARVYGPLARYYRSYEKIRDPESGFYRTGWASMDNSPRNPQTRCGIDTTSEVVLFARNLASIARELGKENEARSFEAEAAALTRTINELLWDEKTGFYYGWGNDNKRHSVRTIAAFWTLLAQIPDREKALRLVSHLKDKKKFKRVHLVPTVPADQAGYVPSGGYWRGSVWPPTTAMVVRGLETYGFDDLACEIALNHLRNVVKVFQETGTIWENYAPDSVAPGKPAKRDFVGWSGLGPIVFLIEYGIGIKACAADNSIIWTVRSPQRVGIENFWFGGKTVTLICGNPDKKGRRKVEVTSDRPFTLTVKWKEREVKIEVPAGETITNEL